MFKEIFGGMFGGDSAEFENATVQKTQNAIENTDVQFIDVRSKGEFVSGHAENAVNIPLNVLQENLEKFDKEKPVYVICQSGMRSQTGARIFAKAGFKEVYNVAGGTIAWMSAGLPTKR